MADKPQNGEHAARGPAASHRRRSSRPSIRGSTTCVSEHNPDAGRVTVRRLNRAEYNNTIRDLIGLDLHPADEFPTDDVGYGFDNIGEVLSTPTVLLEMYLASAEKVIR